MFNKFRIAGVIAIIVFILYITSWTSGKISEYYELKESNEQLQEDLQGKDQVIENQNNEIINKDKFILTNEKTIIRKNINNSVPSDDNVKWMREHRCKDCK